VLSIEVNGAELGLSWRGDGFVLQETVSLSPPVQWQTIEATIVGEGDWHLVSVPISGTARFYRLIEAP